MNNRYIDNDYLPREEGETYNPNLMEGILRIPSYMKDVLDGKTVAAGDEEVDAEMVGKNKIKISEPLFDEGEGHIISCTELQLVIDHPELFKGIVVEDYALGEDHLSLSTVIQQTAAKNGISNLLDSVDTFGFAA